MNEKSEAVAGVFDRAATTYDNVGVEFFSTIGRLLVADADIRSGERVLDVGCGRGAVLFPAAERVAPEGSVTGIDLAPSMVALTARDAHDRGLDQVSVQRIDAQSPTFPDALYDVVTASLVVFFLPDALAALRAWRSLLADGGRLAMTTFAGDDDERWNWLGDVFASDNPAPQPYDEGNPFRSTDRISGMLQEAGFAAPQSTVRPMTLEFSSPEHWLDWSWSAGMRAEWEGLSEERRPVARGEAVTHLEAMQDLHGTIPLDMSIRYTVAGR